MKKYLYTVLFAILLGLYGFPAQAQSPGDISPFITHTSANYQFIVEPGAVSSLPSLIHELESRFELYNRLFRFNTEMLPAPLRVSVFINPASYDSYLGSKLEAVNPGAIYLHYDNYIFNELVVLRGSPEEPAMLAGQSFIQFLKGFIPNPPLWLLEGFSIYFNKIRYDSEDEVLLFEENLSWLNTAKDLGQNTAHPVQILTAGADQQTRDLRISSWALVSFLMHNSEYFRTLTESFMVLLPQNSTEENSRAVMDRFSIWTDFDVLYNEYNTYINSRKTFQEHIEEGRLYLETADVMMAELSFMSARDQRPYHYAPYYYLGLLYYEENIPGLAEEYYLLSFENGGDEALILYALGINAIRAGRYDDAISWLENARTLDPARYRARTDELIERLISIP